MYCPHQLLSLYSGRSCFLLSRVKPFRRELDNTITKRRCLCACSHMHFLFNNGKNWNVFVNTAKKIPRGPFKHSVLLSPGGNSVHLLFPLGKQNRCKSWARRGEVQPILEHKLPVPSDANRAEEEKQQGKAERQEISASLTCIWPSELHVTPQKKTNLGEKCSRFFYCLEVQRKRTWQGNVCITDHLILCNT